MSPSGLRGTSKGPKLNSRVKELLPPLSGPPPQRARPAPRTARKTLSRMDDGNSKYDDFAPPSSSQSQRKMTDMSFIVVGDYEPGKWTHRCRYLPTVVGADENDVIVERFLQMLLNDNLDGVKLLLHSGVPPCMTVASPRRTALHIAAERNATLMCQLLLSFRADPHIEDCVGWTPVLIARELEFLHLVHLFERSHGEKFTPPPGEKTMRLELRSSEPNFMDPPGARPPLSIKDSSSDNRGE